MWSVLAFLLIACVCVGSRASAEELSVLVPVIANGKPVQKADPGGRMVPVVARLHSGALYEQLQKEAAQGFTSVVLALDELAQRKAGATVPSPTWLFLSGEEGGFVRKGFWLRDPHDDRERPQERDRRERRERSDVVDPREERFVSDPFVDLVVDAESLTSGSFEEIFAHEMGHVFLRRLVPTLPQGYSRTPHGSLTVTDNPTAFDEGFAIHLQGLARRMTRNEALRSHDLGLDSKPFLSWWLSNIDRASRIEGMRQNWFVQAQIALPGTGDAIARRDNSTLFDTSHLKNGNQMMASEGVIATLFYRWLVPGPADRVAVIQRYASLFDALVVLNRRQLAAEAPLFLDLIEAYRIVDAKAAARLLALTLDTTYGATADGTLAAQFEALAADGRLGKKSQFTSELKGARAALSKVQEAAAKSPQTARAALGPDIWLLSEPRLAINLNTAERESLIELPGVEAAAADRALESRRRKGPFRDLNDFIQRAGVGAKSLPALTAMASAMVQAGPYARE